MSNRTKEERRRASLPPGMLPKAERRALGKQAALQRARARRSRKIRNNAAVVLAAGAVIVALAGAFGAFSDNSAAPGASASASASAQPSASGGFTTPDGADPALEVKPVVTAGKGDVTKLQVTTLIEGKGAKVQSGQTITVNYVGVNYKTGAEFDSSWSRGESASFPIGTGNVIKGWDQGLVGVTIGSRVQLDIPADLAYGETSSSGGPAGDLRFVVDILDAK